MPCQDREGRRRHWWVPRLLMIGCIIVLMSLVSQTGKVHIIPIGSIEEEIVELVGKAVAGTFQQTTVCERALPVPQNAFVATRGQFHATTILRWMRVFYSARLGYGALLGITDEDLFAPGLNFIFGQADVSTKTTIISLARLRPGFYGLEEDKDLFHLRAAKEAIHELGHTCGLSHCPNPGCVMFFSNCLSDTDRKGPGFCDGCRVLLAPGPSLHS